MKFPSQRYSAAGCDIARKLYDLQSLAVENLRGDTKQMPIETSIYEIIAIQNILLLKPDQHNDAMIEIFGAETLDQLHKERTHAWLDDCPPFANEEFNTLSRIVNNYQEGTSNLKETAAALLNMTLTMDKVKTAVVDAVRRLIEKLPLKAPLDLLTSETELWSKYADPVLDSLLSSPEERVHLRWTNLKCNDDDAERPDGIISVMNQSRWGRNYGHGEVKVAEPTDNVHALSWDLCRLAFFNKAQINDANTRSAFAFQVKGNTLVGSKKSFLTLENRTEHQGLHH
ncbi:hypothetical protein BX666DRAFT_2009580 [Dichotomocladium elegans]|nr:hypothetical protein BX666DRAFT_2009580 [Dichotomocladium elegans]